jgi:hypothetical protein
VVKGLACWPLVPKFAGSNPAEAVGFLRAHLNHLIIVIEVTIAPLAPVTGQGLLFTVWNG